MRQRLRQMRPEKTRLPPSSKAPKGTGWKRCSGTSRRQGPVVSPGSIRYRCSWKRWPLGLQLSRLERSRRSLQPRTPVHGAWSGRTGPAIRGRAVCDSTILPSDRRALRGARRIVAGWLASRIFAGARNGLIEYSRSTGKFRDRLAASTNQRLTRRKSLLRIEASGYRLKQERRATGRAQRAPRV